jgi:hypothetical protein
LALFLTFSTYGTGLHGTDKGKGSVDRRHNQFGGEFVTPDTDRLESARSAMKEPPYVLDSARRDTVRDAIVSLARK